MWSKRSVGVFVAVSLTMFACPNSEDTVGVFDDDEGAAAVEPEPAPDLSVDPANTSQSLSDAPFADPSPLSEGACDASRCSEYLVAGTCDSEDVCPELFIHDTDDGLLVQGVFSDGFPIADFDPATDPWFASLTGQTEAGFADCGFQQSELFEDEPSCRFMDSGGGELAPEAEADIAMFNEAGTYYYFVDVPGGDFDATTNRVTLPEIAEPQSFECSLAFGAGLDGEGGSWTISGGTTCGQ